MTAQQLSLLFKTMDANDGDDFDAQIFYLTSNSDGSTITAELVGTIVGDGDSSSIAFGDFA